LVGKTPNKIFGGFSSLGLYCPLIEVRSEKEIKIELFVKGEQDKSKEDFSAMKINL